MTDFERPPARKRTIVEKHLVKILLIFGFSFIILFLIVPRALQIVPAGYVGVVFSTLSDGTQTDEDKILNEGLHIINPFNVVSLYSRRLQVKQFDVAALSSEGLVIKMQMSLRFTVEKKYAGFLHQALGPNYIDSYLVPAAQRITFSQVAIKKAEDLYSSARGTIKANIENLLREDLRKTSTEVAFEEAYITLNDVLIRQIKLPDIVNEAIDYKESLRQQREGYAFRLQIEDLERDRKRVEAEGIQVYQRIIADSLTPNYLRYEGIKATLKLSESQNSKVVVIGSDGQLPIILDTNAPYTPAPKATKTLGGMSMPTVAPQGDKVPTPTRNIPELTVSGSDTHNMVNNPNGNPEGASNLLKGENNTDKTGQQK